MNLRNLREQAGITQTELQKLSGVRQVTISKIERGGSEMPTLDTARKLVQGLRKAGIKGITVDSIFPAKKESPAS